MVEKKIYVTGGIGAKPDGESFGANYELPNLTAYNETCAAIGSVYWNNRLFNLTGDVKYNDVLERTLYNGLISGLSLSGTEFFYPNALEADGKFEFNRGTCTRQGWFDCSCCPTNLIRFIPAIPGLIYATQKDTLYVNLYMSNHANVTLENNTIAIKQQTSYPWKGKVTLNVDPKKQGNFTVKMRVPGWARNEVLPGGLYSYSTNSAAVPTLSINGKMVASKMESGYFVISRNWKAKDVVEVNFPMEVREVKADPKIIDDRDKISLEYGPLVYAVEGVDNKKDIDNISLNSKTAFKVKSKPKMLHGIYTIEGISGDQDFTAIPYYAWSNRGVGKMKVWLPNVLAKN